VSTGTTNLPLLYLARGTTDPTVFFVQDNTLRAIPDAETLKYLMVGQTVQTLTDAQMAAFTVGQALPSRADGQLIEVPSILGPPFPSEHYYAMYGGLLRSVDAPTIAAMENTGVQMKTIAFDDALLISDGDPLPTRQDGTVYQGSGAVFAWLLAGGYRTAMPDATSLLYSGHWTATPLAISADDLAWIPELPAQPSTSKFLKPPPATVPLLLLPVRVETRFQMAQNELWLRVYPDDVHINSFEPELTADESTARTKYLAQAKVSKQTAQDAFASLAQKYGPERAAWITSPTAQTGTKAGQWTQAPFTNVLPERWIVMGYQGSGAGQVLAIGPPIAKSLAVGPDPAKSTLTTDPGTQWLSDFDTAVAAGMGFRIPVSDTAGVPIGFTRILVFGLRSELDPAASVALFGSLLQAHHYTDGFELLPHGAPTNNTQDVSSAFSTHDPNFATLFSIEQGPALCPGRATADGDRLARAIGLDPALLAHISGANGGQDEDASAINNVLWPATWGYFLEQIITGVVPSPGTMLPLARDHFNNYVRARGHYPILRIGSQPYGVLPVMFSGSWKPLEGGALDAPLMNLLSQMRPTWEASTNNVPQIYGAPDADAALVSLLGMTPASENYATRSVTGPEYNLSYWRYVQWNPGADWWTALAQKAQLQAGYLGPQLAATRLANSTFASQSFPLTDIVVAPAPLDGLPAPDYIAQIAGLTWEQLRDLPTPAAPVPVLFLLLRHAALRQYVDTASDLLAAAGGVPPTQLIEPELLGLSAGLPRPTPWDILGTKLSDKGPVGAYLDSAKSDQTLPEFVAFWTSLAQLSSMTAVELDAVTRETMDLASHRLDAWLSSFAQYRLDQTRNATPKGGVVLGAYSWVEYVWPQASPDPSAGFVHAPSLAHATTAAVMRSAYLTHQEEATTAAAGPPAQSPLQINLTSDKVRLGLDLLDGVRQGQPLGALLGYRFERSIQEAGLGGLIDRLRAIAITYTSDVTGTTTTESVAPNDVIDGLVLLRNYQNDSNFWINLGLGPQQLRFRVAAALQQLQDAVDSVADLALSESVHQLLRGNTVRAGATLDAIARGDVPPPDLDVVETPRAGNAFTHRMLAVASGTAAPGWAATPRAQAEPRLNAWAAALLGSPARVRIRANYLDAAGNVVGSLEFGLDSLAIAPVDLPALPEGDGLTGELGNRLLLAAAAKRPAGVAATTSIHLLSERDPAWSADVVFITEFNELLRALSRFVAGARAMTPQDLVRPGSTPGAVDTAELQSRADAAEAQMRSALTALGASTPSQAALLTGSLYGIASALPSSDSSQWAAQAKAAATELTSRGAALDKLAAGFSRTGAAQTALIAHDVSRLQVIFGQSFVVLPALASAMTATWVQFWSNSTALQGGDPLVSVTWRQRMARIRPGVSRFDMTLLYAEALAGKSIGQLEVAQLPVIAKDRWIALDQLTDTSSSRLSLVAYSPTPYVANAPVAGLMIDEWVEVIPSAQQITGVSFHQPDPTARAPQSLLLAVRPDDFPEWTLESVEGTILEALDLAKLRAVDPDCLNSLGHFLPALYFAYNSAVLPPDAVSIDFQVAQTLVETRSN
jgi:hypothetical protein